MSDKYVAKKYAVVGSVTDKLIQCPNCHQPMTLAGRVIYCVTPSCKLQDVPYREVKSLATIERIDRFGVAG